MSDLVYVLDTETTGLNGYPYDVIVDIAICEVDLDDHTVKEVYSSIVGHDISEWTDKRDAWIFKNTDLTVEMVKDAPPLHKVVYEVRDLLDGKCVTSYNVGFDMDRFLNAKPWRLNQIARIKPCIMLASVDVCKIPGYYNQYKWPKLQEAYNIVTENDPAGIKGNQTHRALSDTLMASCILLSLHDMGVWKS